MKRLRLAIACLLLLTAVGCRHRKVNLTGAVLRASFIFEGTIVQTGQSLEPRFLQSGPTTHVVRVERVFADVARYSEFANQQVTVRVLPGSAVPARRLTSGQRLVFLTTPLLFAGTLAVEGYIQQPNARTVAVVNQKEDLRLRRRIQQASLIISGAVVSVRPLRPPGVEENLQPDRVEFEHDPVWNQATVSVTGRGKGRLPGPTVEVLFPTSRDIAWFRAPRYSVQQSGIWLLQANRNTRQQQKVFTALDPLDFQSLQNQSSVLNKLIRPVRRQTVINPAPKKQP